MRRADPSPPAAGRSGRRTGGDAVWVAVTSTHLMLGHQFAREAGRRLRFADVAHCDLAAWGAILGAPVRPFALRMLVGPLVAAAARALRGRASGPVLYLPHLSALIFRRRQLWVLRVLQRLSLVGYYDDGMAAVSTAGILWRDGLVPVAPERLISWDYAFLPPLPGATRLSVRDSHAVLSRRFAGAVAAPPAPAPPGGDPAGRVLVIASKWLDRDALMAALPADVGDVVYVPHYRAAKNDEFLMRHARVWRPHPNLELALPGVVGGYGRCFFGVTSTIFYVLEAVRGAGAAVETVFVPLVDVAGAAYPGEARDFLERLRTYEADVRIAFPGTAAAPPA